MIPLAAKPDHVPEDLVVKFDLFNLPGGEHDVQLACRAFQNAERPIFWTPHNGGHWVVTTAEDIETVMSDYEHFSSKRIAIPNVSYEMLPKLIPIELDPPEHAAYRKPLTRALLPKEVNVLDEKVRRVCQDLVDEVAPRGACEFVNDFALAFPIMIFLDLVELPREDRHYLVPLVAQSTRAKDNIEQRNIGFADGAGGETAAQTAASAAGDDKIVAFIPNSPRNSRSLCRRLQAAATVARATPPGTRRAQANMQWVMIASTIKITPDKRAVQGPYVHFGLANALAVDWMVRSNVDLAASGLGFSVQRKWGERASSKTEHGK